MSLPIIKRKDLPNSGLTKDWSNVPLNQMVQVSSMEFCVDVELNILWRIESEKISQRAKELNAKVLTYPIIPADFKSNQSEQYAVVFKPI